MVDIGPYSSPTLWLKSIHMPIGTSDFLGLRVSEAITYLIPLLPRRVARAVDMATGHHHQWRIGGTGAATLNVRPRNARERHPCNYTTRAGGNDAN
jgi:hypothetical protein